MNRSLLLSVGLVLLAGLERSGGGTAQTRAG